MSEQTSLCKHTSPIKLSVMYFSSFVGFYVGVCACGVTLEISLKPQQVGGFCSKIANKPETRYESLKSLYLLMKSKSKEKISHVMAILSLYALFFSFQPPFSDGYPGGEL